MTKFALFGLQARSLDEARALVETTIEASLAECEGHQMGGVYFDLGFPDRYVILRNNVDLDDDEMELDGLHEHDFPQHPYLVYIDFVDRIPAAQVALRKIEARPELFKKLRSS